jgi:protein-tyrosine phosphatase
MIRVLFVCAGNICRSPMAEAVFQHKVKEAGLDDIITIDSAGTGRWHIGERAHHGTLNVLQKHNIPYNGHARQIRHSDLKEFDYILAMDRDNLHDINYLNRNNADTEIKLFLDYANSDALTDVSEVPDPYYAGNFEEVYRLVDKGAAALLKHIRKAHHL